MGESASARSRVVSRHRAQAHEHPSFPAQAEQWLPERGQNPSSQIVPLTDLEAPESGPALVPAAHTEQVESEQQAEPAGEHSSSCSRAQKRTGTRVGGHNLEESVS